MKSTSTQSNLSLFLISALNESGGGFLHRLFDGHPSLKVYPFEMQLGTQESANGLSGYCFKPQYRWPKFSENRQNFKSLHQSIINRELKGYLENRSQSKFAAFNLEISYPDWVKNFKERLSRKNKGVSRAVIVESYLLSFFQNWKNRSTSKYERAITGHCPIVLFDTEEIFQDFPNAKMVHIIRDPVSTYFDTKRRLKKLKVGEFCFVWNLCAFLSFYYESKFPNRFLTVRFEDLIKNRKKTLTAICHFFKIPFSNKILHPSWNNTKLSRIKPFGGVPIISSEYDSSIRKQSVKKIKDQIEFLTSSSKPIYNY